MAAARDRTKGIAAAVRAHRHAAPIGVACGVLIGGVMLLGNPFAANLSSVPRARQPEIRLGAAELSLPEPAAAPVPAAPKPTPVQEAAAPKFIVPPAAAPAAPTPPAKQMGGGRRATIIVETLPAKPIIPPFVPPGPKPPAGTAPQPSPALPLDTELGTMGKTAAASLARDG